VRSDLLRTWCTALASAIAGAAGLSATYAGTNGFQAFTLESARRAAALRAPTPVPALVLELADGGRARLADLPASVLLVDFVYTQCSTYCSALGSVYARLQRELAAEIGAGSVALVSISFDAARDRPAELRSYRSRYTRTAAGWQLGRPADSREVERWLRGFGVVVVPDELGGYTHNAALHLVGPDRRLSAIFDLDDIEAAAAAVRRALQRSPTDVAAR